jgi:hypothetical protein
MVPTTTERPIAYIETRSAYLISRVISTSRYSYNCITRGKCCAWYSTTLAAVVLSVDRYWWGGACAKVRTLALKRHLPRLLFWRFVSTLLSFSPPTNNVVSGHLSAGDGCLPCCYCSCFTASFPPASLNSADAFLFDLSPSTSCAVLHDLGARGGWGELTGFRGWQDFNPTTRLSAAPPYLAA